MSEKQLEFRVTGTTGFDALVFLLPLEWQVRYVFRQLTKPGGPWKNVTEASLEATPHIVVLPSGAAYRVLDLRGRKMEPTRVGAVPVG